MEGFPGDIKLKKEKTKCKRGLRYAVFCVGKKNKKMYMFLLICAKRDTGRKNQKFMALVTSKEQGEKDGEGCISMS